MSDLDKKLKEILETHRDATPHPMATKIWMNEIKEAFKYEGYILPGRHESINQRLRDKFVSGELMTGQEWFQKMNIEWNKIVEGGLEVETDWPDQLGEQITELIILAAKRASGLEE